MDHNLQDIYVQSFEMKGKVAPCTLFRPLTTDLEVLRYDLDKHLGETPGFVSNMAVIIDCAGLAELNGDFDLPGTVGVLRAAGLAPVGIQGADASYDALVQELHLGVFASVRQNPSKSAPVRPVPAASTEALIVDKPVRSGQQIYARGRDLVVTAPVGPGAEVIADGNVHVYAPLRGRALAGATGNECARIFCHELRAELVSVAGLYRVSEDLPENVLGAPVQIRLDGRQLVIESI